MKTNLLDAKGRLIGFQMEEQNRIRIFDRTGRFLGSYEKQLNITLDKTGRRIGTENQLTRLLDC